MTRVLVIAPNWIGDAVMAQPLLAELAKQEKTIDVIATPWVAPIFSACKEVDEVITADFKHGSLGLSTRLEVAKKLRSKQYSEAYVLPNSWKSALIPWLAKIPVRVGYLGEMRIGLLNRIRRNPSKKNRPSMVAHYANLANFNRATQFGFPTLRTPELLRTQVQAKLVQWFETQPNEFKLYVLAPGAEYGPAKQWPLDHFAKLAQHILNSDSQAVVTIIGSQKDHIAGDAIRNAITPSYQSRIKNLCGEMSLEESIALVSISEAMVSNDSGMMHVAAAFEVPQIAMFGSSDPKHTPPLSKFAKPIWLGLDCSPCHKRQCPLGHLNCLKQISPELAFTELSTIIQKKG